MSVNTGSLLSIDAGANSKLSAGSYGWLTNDGTVQLLAGAGAVAKSTYVPISAYFWTGTGTYQAVGGTWNATSHVFTVSGVQSGASGSPLPIDRDSTQRVSISDSTSHWTLGVSVLSASTSTPLTITATTVGDGTLASLDSLLAPGQSLLGGWTFSTSGGYTPGDPAYLSFAIGSGYSAGELDLWQYNGTGWSPFSAADLTYDGNYASFAVTALNGFAVTNRPRARNHLAPARRNRLPAGLRLATAMGGVRHWTVCVFLRKQ